MAGTINLFEICMQKGIHRLLKDECEFLGSSNNKKIRYVQYMEKYVQYLKQIQFRMDMNGRWE